MPAFVDDNITFQNINIAWSPDAAHLGHSVVAVHGMHPLAQALSSG